MHLGQGSHYPFSCGKLKGRTIHLRHQNLGPSQPEPLLWACLGGGSAFSTSCLFWGQRQKPQEEVAQPAPNYNLAGLYTPPSVLPAQVALRGGCRWHVESSPCTLPWTCCGLPPKTHSPCLWPRVTKQEAERRTLSCPVLGKQKENQILRRTDPIKVTVL